MFCIPYAGGSATTYLQWNELLGSHVQLHPMELAGRGARYEEPSSIDFSNMLNDLYGQIRPYVGKMPYSIFGHSMGAILAFELYHLLIKEGYPEPVHLFISGRPAPALDVSRKNVISKLLGNKLTKFFYKNEGIPSEIAKQPELYKKFKKILMSDISVMETYVFQQKSVKISCPVTILSGTQDHISEHEIQSWNDYATSNCTVTWIKGDHFFIHNNMKELISIINHTIPVTISS